MMCFYRKQVTSDTHFLSENRTRTPNHFFPTSNPKSFLTILIAVKLRSVSQDLERKEVDPLSLG